MSWCGGSYVQEQTQKSSISGCMHTWKLWRHCCCRYGWYPLLVAPLATAALLLSLYSSAGCDFIRVSVGFTPSNAAWDSSSAEFGIFMYQAQEADSNKYRAAFLGGCRAYSEDFAAEFIEEDKTWEVTKIMAYVSGISSLVAMITSWLFVITPIPASFFWPGFLLPALMTSFLTEGSKFLIFDTSVCRNTAWFPSGADSLPRVAEECRLGETGVYSIASVSIFFVCLILVCLKAPTKRELEPFYGTDFEEDEFESTRHQNDRVFGNPEPPYHRGNPEAFEIGREVSQVPRIISSTISTDSLQLQFSTPNSKATTYQQDLEEASHNFGEDFSHQDNDNLVSARMKTLNNQEDARYPTKSSSASAYSHDSLEQGTPSDHSQLKQKSTSPLAQISESRLCALDNINKNTRQQDEQDTEMIEKFVHDFNSGFEMDGENKGSTEAAESKDMDENNKLESSHPTTSSDPSTWGPIVTAAS